ncbi:MAG: hypothetical protein AAF098_16890 [Pseudomonadota bacterium]
MKFFRRLVTGSMTMPRGWGVPSPYRVYGEMPDDLRKISHQRRNGKWQGRTVWQGLYPPTEADKQALQDHLAKKNKRRKSFDQIIHPLSIVGRRNPEYSSFGDELRKRKLLTQQVFVGWPRR